MNRMELRGTRVVAAIRPDSCVSFRGVSRVRFPDLSKHSNDGILVSASLNQRRPKVNHWQVRA